MEDQGHGARDGTSGAGKHHRGPRRHGPGEDRRFGEEDRLERCGTSWREGGGRGEHHQGGGEQGRGLHGLGDQEGQLPLRRARGLHGELRRGGEQGPGLDAHASGQGDCRHGGVRQGLPPVLP